MNLGFSKSVLSKLQRFQREYISFDQMKEMVLDTYQPFTIKWKKKDGTMAQRDMFTVFGPGGRAMSGVRYWTPKYNYMIAYSNTDGGFRTIRLKDVEWIEKDNQRYYLR
jgi:hypothetical protein